jgi:hypothetical protein
MQFDDVARNTIQKLSDTFGKTYIARPEIISQKSIGLELEIKFKFLFPELHKKYFTNNIAYYNLNQDEKERIAAEISLSEKDILPLFEKTVACGIPKGLDKYWEFSFTPVNNLTLLVYQADILGQLGLIPQGKHSLHITVGDVKATPRMYWILFTLELLFCTKERIQSGFGVNPGISATWAKKGEGGIMVKNQYDLVNSEKGFEFRTLQFDGDPDSLYKMLFCLNKLMSGSDDILDEVKHQAVSLGLKNENWRKPHTNPDIWKLYVNNFDHLSTQIKKLVIA